MSQRNRAKQDGSAFKTSPTLCNCSLWGVLLGLAAANNSTHSNTKFHHSTIPPFHHSTPPEPNRKRIALRLCTPKKRSKKELSAFASFASWGKIANFVQLKTGDDPWRLKNITVTYFFFVFHSRYLYFRHCQWWRFPGLLPFLPNNCFPKPLQFFKSTSPHRHLQNGISGTCS